MPAICLKCIFFSIKSRKRSSSILSENVCISKKAVVFTKRVCPLWNVSKDKNVKDWENVKVIGHQMWTLFAYFPEAYIDIMQCLFKETIPYFWSGSSQIWKKQTTHLAFINLLQKLTFLFNGGYRRFPLLRGGKCEPGESWGLPWPGWRTETQRSDRLRWTQVWGIQEPPKSKQESIPNMSKPMNICNPTETPTTSGQSCCWRIGRTDQLHDEYHWTFVDHWKSNKKTVYM